MFNKLKLLFLLCLCAQKVFALNDASGFLVIPSPSVLGDKSFQARGTLGYHHVTPEDRFPFVGSFRYGIFDSFDLGLLFGSTVSLDVKNQLIQTSGAIPAVAVGARAFVQSPEAYFYSIPKSDRKNQTGEFYTSFGWDSDWWNIIGGVSAFPSMDADAVAPFWGFEQKFGSKFSIIYEGFFRYGYTHHNGAFLLKPVKSLQISVGATEFYRYFLNEDGDFTFRTKNANASNGYRTPGIYLSIAISGLLGEPKNRDCKCDSIANAKTDSSAVDTSAIDSAAYQSDILREFEEIVQGYFVTDSDLDSLFAREEALMGKGLMSKSFVLSEAQNKNSETNKRITAIRIMSHFPDSIFIEPLGSIIEDPSNEAVAREAVLALGTINTPKARNMLSAVASKTSGIINKTIMDILGEL